MSLWKVGAGSVPLGNLRERYNELYIIVNMPRKCPLYLDYFILLPKGQFDLPLHVEY